jgi:hypothetical protein
MKLHMLPKTLLCIAVFSASSVAMADTVWMKNGDRLTGTIKVFDGGKLMLDTKYGGSIPLDMKEVKTLQSDQELLVKQDAYSGEKAKSLKASDDGKVTLENGEAPKTVELASIQQIMKPKPVIQDLTITGAVDLASAPTPIPMTTTSLSGLRPDTANGAITPRANTTANPRMKW